MWGGVRAMMENECRGNRGGKEGGRRRGRKEIT